MAIKTSPLRASSIIEGLFIISKYIKIIVTIISLKQNAQKVFLKLYIIEFP